MAKNSFSLKSLLSFAAILSSVAAFPAAAQGESKGRGPKGAVNATDYVIVGAGPAGFVLAERLSRNKRVNVVLLEAGPDGLNSSLINSE